LPIFFFKVVKLNIFSRANEPNEIGYVLRIFLGEGEGIDGFGEPSITEKTLFAACENCLTCTQLQVFQSLEGESILSILPPADVAE
jgi:hypothetical protein